MFDSPIRPVRPVNAVRAIRDIDLRRRPSRGQLRTWLAFAQRCARRVASRSPQAAPEADPAPQHHAEAGHEVDIEV
jgi:hypothetical protein